MKTNIYKFNSDGNVTLAATYVNDYPARKNMALFLMLLNNITQWWNADLVAKFDCKVKRTAHGYLTFTFNGFDYFTKDKTED